MVWRRARVTALIARMSWSLASTSMLVVGSSKSTTSAWRATARPTATFWRSPAPSSSIRAPPRSRMSSASSISSTRRSRSAAETARSRRRGSAMFSATLSVGYMTGYWNTIPTSRRRAGRSVTSRPPIRMRPSVGASSPAIIRMSVVLPQPEGPRRQVTAPEAKRVSSASTATVSPKRRVTRSSAISTIRRRSARPRGAGRAKTTRSAGATPRRSRAPASGGGPLLGGARQGEGRAGAVEIDDELGAQILHQRHGALEGHGAGGEGGGGLGAQPHRHGAVGAARGEGERSGLHLPAGRAARHEVGAGEANEPHRGLAPRGGVDPLHGPGLHHAAGVEDDELLRHRQRLQGVGGGVEDGRAEISLEPLQIGHQPLAQLVVEPHQRVVEHEDARVAHEPPRHRDALLLAPRERVGRLVEQVADRERPGDPLHPLGDLPARGARQAQRVAHVLAHAQMRVEREALRHVAQGPPRGGRVGDVLAVQQDAALVGALEPDEEAQEHRLAAPGRPADHGEAPIGRREAHAVERRRAAVAPGHALEGDLGHPLSARAGSGTA